MSNDFVHMLMEMRNGAVAGDCTRKFNELIAAVMETGKAGAITLQVKVSPSRVAAGKVSEVEAEHACTIKKPELSIGKSVFFVTDDGALTRQDPDQITFEEIHVQESRPNA